MSVSDSSDDESTSKGSVASCWMDKEGVGDGVGNGVSGEVGVGDVGGE